MSIGCRGAFSLLGWGIDFMKIAFIGHSYHKQTGSSKFFIDLLKKIGRVQGFYDESWRGEPSGWARTFDPGEFDCVVIWQVAKAFEYFREPHPNVVFAPMYDAIAREGGIHWPEAFSPAKVLCFSSELQRQVSRYTERCEYFQYYPDPRQYPVTAFGKMLRGIFWNRVASIDENVIARLCGDAVFDRFTLHNAADPFSGARMMEESPIASRSLARDGWKVHRRDYLKEVERHNIFFAPRPCEGIGMSVLEAMAMGLCVVATDMPTHNEYITHGENGILYDLANVRPVSLADAAELGARARESVEKGFRRWSALEDQLMSFVSLPTSLFDTLLGRCSA